MATITEVERLALDLSEGQRAILAAHLLSSLSPILSDQDDGLSEALGRDEEFDGNPTIGISLDELDNKIDRRRT